MLTTITCDKCGKVAACMGGGEVSHAEADPETDCDGTLYSEGPMMSYFYPCGWSGDAQGAAIAIARLPLCVVELRDGTRGLALTGGGMDLSWEICEAYIRLGFLPPLHYAGDLPSMADKKLDERTKLVLAGAAESARAVANQAARAGARIREMRAKLGATIKGPIRKAVRK